MYSPEVIILVAGYGTRLYPVSDFVPKSMLTVGKQQLPVLEYIIEHCKTVNSKDFTICVNKNNGKQIENYFQDGSRLDVDIQYSYNDHPLGTAGEIQLAFDRGMIKTNRYINHLIYYGDTLCSTDIEEMITRHRQQKGDVSVVVNDEIRIPVGYIEDVGGIVQRIIEKPKISDILKPHLTRTSNFKAGGVLPIFYVTTPDFFQMCEIDLDIVNDILPQLQDEGFNLLAYHDHAPFVDVGDWKNFQLAQEWEL